MEIIGPVPAFCRAVTTFCIDLPVYVAFDICVTYNVLAADQCAYYEVFPCESSLRAAARMSFHLCVRVVSGVKHKSQKV